MGQVLQFVDRPGDFRYTLKQKAWVARRYLEAGRLFDKYMARYEVSQAKHDRQMAMSYFIAMERSGDILDAMGGAA